MLCIVLYLVPVQQFFGALNVRRRDDSKNIEVRRKKNYHKKLANRGKRRLFAQTSWPRIVGHPPNPHTVPSYHRAEVKDAERRG